MTKKRNNTHPEGDRKVRGWARKIRHRRARQEALRVYLATMVLHGFDGDFSSFAGPYEYVLAKRAARVAYDAEYKRLIELQKGKKVG